MIPIVTHNAIIAVIYSPAIFIDFCTSGASPSLNDNDIPGIAEIAMSIPLTGLAIRDFAVFFTLVRLWYFIQAQVTLVFVVHVKAIGDVYRHTLEVFAQFVSDITSTALSVLLVNNAVIDLFSDRLAGTILIERLPAFVATLGRI